MRPRPSAMVNGRALRLYLAGSVLWLAAYPFLPAAVKPAAFLVVALATVPAVGRGVAAVRRGRRLAWWLLLAAMAVLNLGLILRIADPSNEPVGVLLNAAGNVLILAAAVAMVLRSGRNDFGGVIDASIIGLSVGGVLCIAVFGLSDGIDGAARVNLFVVLFALSGVLGALIRLGVASPHPFGALQWLMLGLGLALVGNIVQAVAANRAATESANLLFLGAYTSVGAFGLHPTGPLMARAGTTDREDRLTAKRLVFLGAATAVIPVVVGVLMLLSLGTKRDGLVLLVAGVLTAALVMVRIGRLSADRSRIERALRQQAAADPLTGLPNRRTLLGRLAMDLDQRRRCTVLFCDLDGFKAINDQRGHDAGDELLRHVATRLSSSVRSTDIVSRFGGDEFVIVLDGDADADVDAIIERIRTVLGEPFHLSSGELRLGASIGVASRANGAADDLIRAADANMYRAKQTNGATPTVRVADAETHVG